MGKTQTRRAVSLRGYIYADFKSFCDEKQVPMSALVEQLIAEHMNAAGAPPLIAPARAVAPRSAPQPRPVAAAKPAPRPAPPRPPAPRAAQPMPRPTLPVACWATVQMVGGSHRCSGVAIERGLCARHLEREQRGLL